jgi:uncharacterized protein (TIGR00369 family)
VTIPADPNCEARIRASFAKQQFMATLGASIASVKPGEVLIDIPFRDDLRQQHGFLHAGVVTSVIDSACGYAALTLMPADRAVLSVEFKVNLLAPAQGAAFRARGHVVRAGRTLTVCSGELRVVGSDSVVAIMQATMMAVEARSDRRD